MNADQPGFDEQTAPSQASSGTAPQSTADSADRRIYQFSISSLLLLTLTVALAVTSLLMYRRMADAERELVKLRNEAGYLTIEDEKVFQAISIRCEEPLTWKWRAYLPRGSNYSWHLNSGMIPANGVGGGSGGSSREGLPLAQGKEVVITVSIRKDPEPKNKRWVFSVRYRSADGTEKHSTSTSIPDQIMDQILQAQMTQDECFADLKAETRKRGESIVLIKHRTGEQTPSKSWSSSLKPQPGFAVWLDEEN
jgi:hypothetical protein